MPTPSQSSSDNTDTIVTPSWDTSPLTLPAYAVDLLRWLPAQDKRYSTLVKTYTVLDKTKVLCVNQNHIDRILNGVLPTGTFKEPIVYELTTSVAFVVPHGGPGLDAKSPRHEESPEKVFELDEAMWETIKPTIEDVATRDEIASSISSLGTGFLVFIQVEIKRNMALDESNYGSKILQEIKEHEDAGIAAPSITAFNPVSYTHLTLPTKRIV